MIIVDISKLAEMKLKYLYTGMLSLALMSTACTDDSDYPQPEPINPEVATGALDVYFYPASTTSYKIGVSDTELTVDVYRSNGDGAKTFDLSFESDHASLFTVPASVTFADKQTKVSVPFSFVATDFPAMEPVDITFIVGEGVNSPWAYQRLKYAVTFEPWEDITGPDGEDGTWVDDMFTSWYNLPAAALSWKVKIQINTAIDGLYRIVDPYGKQAFNGLNFGDGAWSTGAYIDGQNHYLYFNCTDPEMVYICDETGSPLNGQSVYVFNTGANVGYGTVGLTGVYNMLLAQGKDDPSACGSFKDGIIKFPAGSLVIIDDDGAGYANKNGGFRVLWPGVTEAPEKEWESIGSAKYTDVLVTPFMTTFNNETEPMSQTWDVEVEQSVKDPSVYRIVNPFKSGVMPDGFDYEGDKYLYIDAFNPDCVLIENQEILSVDVEEIGGSIVACNLAYEKAADKMTDEDIIAGGFNDVFADKVFTFAPGHMLIGCPDATDVGLKVAKAYNTVDAGKLVLSAEATEAAAANYRVAGKSRSVADATVKRLDSKQIKPFSL